MKYFTITTREGTHVAFLSAKKNPKFNIAQLMRIGFVSLALVLITFQLLLALPVKSQKISAVEVKLELKNETLLAAFKKIEQQTPFRFVYRKGDLISLPSKSITSSTYTVEEALNLLLANTEFSYRQIDNNVLIVTGQSMPDQQQVDNFADIPIRGQVTDTKGETLPGVSIKLKGTQVGTTTDVNGNYSINVPDRNSILVFTYIGFVTREVTVNDNTTLNVNLDAANTALNEVVVTALGIKRAAKSLTYSAQVIDGASLDEAKETNVINSLQGKVAGVVISKSATGPGSSSRVILRGNRSITGGNEPLYVIDGVPMNSGKRASGGGSFGGRDGGGGISMINPDNIESMTVLKGASAAALYGSAGQNGAIVITTKSGK
ncbi:MAG TPA: carboxypeptidase-like regulatory domain-containing protein, partial [Daejeonella sp.]